MPIIIILRLRKNIKIGLTFVSNICWGMHGTLTVESVYIRVGKHENNMYVKIVSDVLGKGRNTWRSFKVHHLGLSVLWFSR